MGWACRASVSGIGSVWGLVLWAAVMGGVFGSGFFSCGMAWRWRGFFGGIAIAVWRFEISLIFPNFLSLTFFGNS